MKRVKCDFVDPGTSHWALSTSDFVTFTRIGNTCYKRRLQRPGIGQIASLHDSARLVLQ